MALPDPQPDHATIFRQLAELLKEACALVEQLDPEAGAEATEFGLVSTAIAAPKKTYSQHTPIQEFDASASASHYRARILEKYRKHIDQISEDQWVAVEGHLVFGLSHAELAAQLGISEKAVYGRLERARKAVDDREQQLRAEYARLVGNRVELD